MRKSVVKQKLATGQPVLVTQLHLTDPSLFELASLMGFDALWMDLEHHTYSLETAASLMRAARVGTSDIMARCAKSEFPRLSRFLEAGAQGIMYARCESADEAREVVNWAKFAPEGRRGLDTGNADVPYCSMPVQEYIVEANRQTFIVIQLEEQRAVDAAEAIASVPGVDVIFLGPGDFSLLSGIPGQFDHPRVQKATETIARAAKNAGIHWGCPSFSPKHAAALIQLGARLITYNADILIIKQGLELIQADFGRLGFTFRNQLNGSATR
jgi:4-hydroxy-2-oxoheptanedioate aldolase